MSPPKMPKALRAEQARRARLKVSERTAFLDARLPELPELERNLPGVREELADRLREVEEARLLEAFAVEARAADAPDASDFGPGIPPPVTPELVPELELVEVAAELVTVEAYRAAAEVEEYRRELAAAWPRALASWRQAHRARLAALHALAREGVATGDRVALDALTRAMEPALERLDAATGAPTGDDPATERLRDRGGLYERDALLAEHLEQLGTDGSELRREGALAGAKRRKAGAEDWATVDAPGVEPAWWAAWRDVLRVPVLLARVLWRGKVQEERKLDARHPPALALVVVRDVERVWYERDHQISFLGPPGEDGAVEIRSAEGEALATTAVLQAADLEGVQRGAQLLGSYTGHLSLRRFAEEGWRRTRNGDANPSILGWDGGLEACAKWLGGASNKTRDELRDILHAGQEFRRSWANGAELGGLWTFSNDPAGPGRRAHLEVRLGRPLMPYMVKALGPRERTLVPVVKMPPRVKAPNTWAAQAAFQFALVRALVEHRAEVVKEGGARFTADELGRMARAVGLSLELLPAILDRWTQDGADGARCLERVGPDRYHLPANADFQDARAFIEAGGRRTLQRKAAGEASVRSAARARRRRPEA